MASTIRDVAARAGLSVATVSKYINGKTVKESTRLAIEEAIKELDFYPNNIAKGLCNAKSFSVQYVIGGSFYRIRIMKPIVQFFSRHDK